MNRLLDSYYQKSDVVTNSYDESMQYDKNGNITHLNRTGVLDSEYTTVNIDDLDYTYNNNQLLKVTDNSANPNGFKDGTNTDYDYNYDANGNMIHDQNKGIENITYNHLNLPTEIFFANGSIINYLYDATGRKVKKIVANANLNTEETTDYMGGYQYLNGYLKFFPTAEGYVNATICDICQENYQYEFSYVYNYVDHLGNIRVSYTQDPLTKNLKILEENHYYPFGLKHTNYNSGRKYIGIEQDFQAIDYGKMKVKPVGGTDKLAYKYKYNGKEFQDELGLNLYDYGARLYDPAAPHFLQIDPLAEKSRRWSPYVYATDNPIVFKDPDGREIVIYYMDQGKEYSYSYEYEKGRNIKSLDNNKFLRNTVKMLDKLVSSGATKDIQVSGDKKENCGDRILQIVKDPKQLSIIEISGKEKNPSMYVSSTYKGDGKKDSTFDGGLGTIKVNDEYGIEFKDSNNNTATNSPTAQLGHEVLHEEHAKNERGEYLDRTRGHHMDRGGSPEEKLTTSEANQVNVRLGEPTRVNYSGTSIPMAEPTINQRN